MRLARRKISTLPARLDPGAQEKPLSWKKQPVWKKLPISLPSKPK